MQEKTKKRISVIAMLAAVLAGFLIQLLLPGLGVRAYANDDYVSVDITKTPARSDLVSMKKDNLSFISDKENIFITMSQYFDLNGNPRTYLYLNYVGDHENDSLSVSLSTATSDKNYKITEEFKTYDLALIDKDSQCNWCKYEISDLPNLDYSTRRYYLSEIIINGKDKIKIDQVFIYNGLSNKTIKVFNQEIETITITDSLVKFFCYGDENDFLKSWGYKGLYEANSEKVSYSDCFYIFFNTDKEMDTLMECEISFQTFKYTICWDTGGYMNFPVTYKVGQALQNGTYSGPGSNLLNGNSNSITSLSETQIVTVEPGTELVSYETEGWFGKYDTQYRELDKIMDLKGDLATHGAKYTFYDEASSYDWGVEFATFNKTVQSTWDVDNVFNEFFVDGTSVYEVAILRLKFVTDGVVHNCYAVDVPDDDFVGEAVDDGESSLFEDVFDDFTSILSLVVIVIALAAVAPAIKPVCEGLVTIIRLPFDLIASLFKKRK
ncbi:MAG: hypothetical protein E7612_08090 [Ruminococcaceae bacterium]|nr:hypothetical protein [Oscillospiraceae bacterium]